MNGNELEIGIGGAFAIAMVALVLRFLSNKKNGKSKITSAGELSPDYWQNENRKIISETLNMSVLPILGQLAAILNEIQRNQQQSNENMIKIITILDARRHDN